MQTNEENVILKFAKHSLLYDLIATSLLTHIKTCCKNVTYVSVHQEKDKMMNFVIIKDFNFYAFQRASLKVLFLCNFGVHSQFFKELLPATQVMKLCTCKMRMFIELPPSISKQV